jgi:hypothetical protein
MAIIATRAAIGRRMNDFTRLFRITLLTRADLFLAVDFFERMGVLLLGTVERWLVEQMKCPGMSHPARGRNV